MNLKQLVLLVKIALSAGLIWFVSTQLDFFGALTQISKMPLGWMIVIILMFYFQLAIAAKRHLELLELLGCSVPYMRCLDAMLIGYFFSQTFISFVGGDAMRTFRLTQSGISIKSSAKSVILDRASGFVGQIALIMFVLPFLLPRLPDVTMRTGLIGIVLATVTGIFVIVIIARIPETSLHHKALLVISDMSQKVIRLLGTVRGVYSFIFMSISISLMNCLIFFVIAASLSIRVSLLDVVFLLPPVFFLSMLPISISGWGIREGATVVALGLAGVSAVDSLSISICFGLALMTISLPGGLIWLITHKTPASNSTELY
jgi:uncharacterized membrane protein YbhN (UPF0104 family)